VVVVVVLMAMMVMIVVVNDSDAAVDMWVCVVRIVYSKSSMYFHANRASPVEVTLWR
jgi:type IV secretory pathway VirB3-like protein